MSETEIETKQETKSDNDTNIEADMESILSNLKQLSSIHNKRINKNNDNKSDESKLIDQLLSINYDELYKTELKKLQLLTENIGKDDAKILDVIDILVFNLIVNPSFIKSKEKLKQMLTGLVILNYCVVKNKLFGTFINSKHILYKLYNILDHDLLKSKIKNDPISELNITFQYKLIQILLNWYNVYYVQNNRHILYINFNIIFNKLRQQDFIHLYQSWAKQHQQLPLTINEISNIHKNITNNNNNGTTNIRDSDINAPLPISDDEYECCSNDTKSNNNSKKINIGNSTNNNNNDSNNENEIAFLKRKIGIYKYVHKQLLNNIQELSKKNENLKKQLQDKNKINN